MDEIREQLKALRRGLDYVFVLLALLVAAILALIWIGNLRELRALRRQLEPEEYYYIIIPEGGEALRGREDLMDREKITVELPVAPGSTVWQPIKSAGIVRPVTVDSITIGQRPNRCYIDTVYRTPTGGQLFQRRRLNQVGRSLFLSEGEAVAALDRAEDQA